MTNDEIRAYAEEHYDEAVQLLKEIAVIPSPTRHEDKRAMFIQKWINNLGGNAKIDHAKNVLCKIPGKSEKIIVFAAHTDIVFDANVPLAIKEEGNRLYCPGIGDDTANLVVLLLILKYVLQSNIQPEYTLLFAADACEEGLGNSDGTREIFRKYGDRIQEFYSFDCYLGYCISDAVGSHRYQISVKVDGGHSYRDFGRPNAIVELADLLQRLYRIVPPTEKKTTFNVGKIEGGTSVNTIAEYAEMLYEFRSPSQSCLQQMETAFWEEIQKSEKQDVQFEVKTIGIRPGTAITDTEALQKWTDRNADIIRKWYNGDMYLEANSTDANIPLSMDIPANTIGVVYGNGAHTTEEWIEPESLKPGLCIALELLQYYL